MSINPDEIAKTSAALLEKLKSRQSSPEYEREIAVDWTTAGDWQIVNLCDPGCAICGGTGYYRVNVPVTDDRFGKALPCPNAELKRMLSGDPRFGLSEKEANGLSWNVIRPGFSDGHKAAEAVRELLDTGYGMAYLFGNYGQAKTLTLKIAVAQSLQSSKYAAYANMSDVLDDLRLAYDEEDSSRELLHRMDWWKSLPLLAIDEIEKVNPTEWAGEKIHQLIDARWVQAVRRESVTLIASNKHPKQLDGYLASRIMDVRCKVIELNGQDGRRVMPSDFRW